jgi:hypothetical protein
MSLGCRIGYYAELAGIQPKVTSVSNPASILQMNDLEPLHILQIDDETEFLGIQCAAGTHGKEFIMD